MGGGGTDSFQMSYFNPTLYNSSTLLVALCYRRAGDYRRVDNLRSADNLFHKGNSGVTFIEAI